MSVAISLDGVVGGNGADIEMYRGEDVVITVDVEEAVAGWSVSFTVRDQFGEPTRIQKTVGSGIVLGSTTFAITLASLDTSVMAAAQYQYDVSRTDSGNKAVLCIGTFTLLPEVTIR